jgi:DNA-binding NtrC family response regulator
VLHNDEAVQVSHLPQPLDSSFNDEEIKPASQKPDHAVPIAGSDKTTQSDSQLIKPLAQIEREAIEQAISLCDGNVPRAAALLDVSPSTIYRKKSTWS